MQSPLSQLEWGRCIRDIPKLSPPTEAQLLFTRILFLFLQGISPHLQGSQVQSRAEPKELWGSSKGTSTFLGLLEPGFLG